MQAHKENSNYSNKTTYRLLQEHSQLELDFLKSLDTNTTNSFAFQSYASVKQELAKRSSFELFLDPRD